MREEGRGEDRRERERERERERGRGRAASERMGERANYLDPNSDIYFMLTSTQFYNNM